MLHLWLLHRYPYLVIAYYFLYMSRVPELGYVCFLAVAPIIQFVLTSMNFWWTGTMVRQLLAKRKSEPSKTD